MHPEYRGESIQHQVAALGRLQEHHVSDSRLRRRREQHDQEGREYPDVTASLQKTTPALLGELRC